MPVHPVNLPVEEIIKNQNENLISIKNSQTETINIGKEPKTIPKDEIFTKEDVMDALEKFARTIEIFNKKFKLDFHEEAKRVVVKVLDAESNKVIREIPSEEMLKLIANIHKFLGVFVDHVK